MRSRPRQDYIRTASNQSDDTLSSKPVLLVSNAGFGLSGSFFSHDSTQVQAEVEFNIQVLIALTHRFGKAMVTRGKGGIISVVSKASFQLFPYMATYAATKAFVLHFSEATLARSSVCSSVSLVSTPNASGTPVFCCGCPMPFATSV